MRDFGEPPGLKVLGFKPRSVLKASYNLTHSTFVYPDEKVVKGSVALFSGLLRELVRADRIAICRFIARIGAHPRLVALLPQPEQLDEAGAQLKPPGFHLIVLPFADDLRHLRFPEGDARPTASDAQVDRAKEIVGRLTLAGRFSPESYDNPVLQHHYAMLQALALDQDSADLLNQPDSTVPNYERIRKRAGTHIAELHATLPPATASPDSRPSPSKRPKADSAKADGPKPAVTFDDVRACAASTPDDLGRFSVALLKEFLESVNVKPKRVKADLVAQVLEYTNAH